MAVYLTLDNEELAKAYDEISDSQFNNGRILIQNLELKPGNSVLDVGSGTGRLGRYVIELIGTSGRYIGVDPLQNRVKLADDKNEHLNAEYRIGTAEDLSFIPDESIDIVYLNAVFHWVINKEKALSEIFRVLKPGGKVGLTTGAKEINTITGINVITDNVLSREPYSKVVKIENAALKQHGLTTSELNVLLVNAGFSIKNIQIKAVSWPYKTANELLRHSEASSFGNYLSHVPDNLKHQAKADIETELDKYKINGEIKFDRYTIFAIAEKR